MAKAGLGVVTRWGPSGPASESPPTLFQCKREDVGPGEGGEVGPQGFSGTDFLRAGCAPLSSGFIQKLMASSLLSQVRKLKVTSRDMSLFTFT